MPNPGKQPTRDLVSDEDETETLHVEFSDRDDEEEKASPQNITPSERLELSRRNSITALDTVSRIGSYRQRVTSQQSGRIRPRPMPRASGLRNEARIEKRRPKKKHLIILNDQVRGNSLNAGIEVEHVEHSQNHGTTDSGNNSINDEHAFRDYLHTELEFEIRANLGELSKIPAVPCWKSWHNDGDDFESSSRDEPSSSSSYLVPVLSIVPSQNTPWIDMVPLLKGFNEQLSLYVPDLTSQGVIEMRTWIDKNFDAGIKILLRREPICNVDGCWEYKYERGLNDGLKSIVKRYDAVNDLNILRMFYDKAISAMMKITFCFEKSIENRIEDDSKEDSPIEEYDKVCDPEEDDSFRFLLPPEAPESSDGDGSTMRDAPMEPESCKEDDSTMKDVPKEPTWPKEDDSTMEDIHEKAGRSRGEDSSWEGIHEDPEPSAVLLHPIVAHLRLSD